MGQQLAETLQIFWSLGAGHSRSLFRLQNQNKFKLGLQFNLCTSTFQ